MPDVCASSSVFVRIEMAIDLIILYREEVYQNSILLEMGVTNRMKKVENWL